MISVAQVLRIHSQLIQAYGGAEGIRNLGLLESALARPFMMFARVPLYATPLEKAAALIESILINHPFIDGNKRTGYALMRAFLLENGLDIRHDDEKSYHFVISIAAGQLKFDDILLWLRENHKLAE
jgi:death-on-curing protein